MLRIAIPNKGALSEKSVELIKEAGYRCSRRSRELMLIDTANDIEFVFLRPRDIAVYVSKGIVQMGITGRDLHFDSGYDVEELMPLGFGKSRFFYAVPNACEKTPDQFDGMRIATSYSRLVKEDMKQRGLDVEVVKLDGAVEISIQLGVADAIADVVESGQTLREAGLKTIGEPIMESEAVVIGHSEETIKDPTVALFLERLRGIVVARDYVMVEYDVPRTALEKACEKTPGIESPTVSPLNNPDWASVKAMTSRKGVNLLLDELYELGARGIIVTDIRTCRL